MKKIIAVVAVILAFSAGQAVYAMEHGEHGAMNMEHGDHQGAVAHQEVVDGVKATFKVMSMKEHMKAMKMEMPAGVKETHHIAAEFKDAKTGKALTEGQVKVKLQGPDKSEQTKELMGMQGHFGADFNLSKPGKYGVMCKFELGDGKVRTAKFWYNVK
jgi:hypothetical protein